MMRDEKILRYDEACPICYSLKLDVIWIGKDDQPEVAEIKVSCLECGETWEDWL